MSIASSNEDAGSMEASDHDVSKGGEDASHAFERQPPPWVDTTPSLAALPASELLLERVRWCSREELEDCSVQDGDVTVHGEIPGPILSAVDHVPGELFRLPSERALARALGANVQVVDGAENDHPDGVLYYQEIWIEPDVPPSDGTWGIRARNRQSEDERSRATFPTEISSFLSEHEEEPEILIALADLSLRELTQHDWPLEDGIRWADWVVYLEEENDRRRAAREHVGRELAMAVPGCAFSDTTNRPGIVLRCERALASEVLSHLGSDPRTRGFHILRPEEDEPGDQLDGAKYRHPDASRLDNWVNTAVTSAPHTGWNGWNLTGPLRVGVIDRHWSPVASHPAYRRSGGQHRIISTVNCADSTCLTPFPWLSTPGEHGTNLLSAFQSILDGQDSSHPGATAQEERSYGAYDVDLRLCNNPSSDASRRCMDWLSTLVGGAPRSEVILRSQGTLGECPQFRSSTSWNTAIDDAAERGSIYVHLSQNSIDRCTPGTPFNTNGPAAPCDVARQASRTDVLTTGGLGACFQPPVPFADPEHYGQLYTTGHLTAETINPAAAAAGSFCDVSGPPNAVDRCPAGGSTGGGLRCRAMSMGGAALHVPHEPLLNPFARTVVDVVAPTWRTFGADSEQVWFWGVPWLFHFYANHGNSRCGTSNAAPFVAAATASVRDWGFTRGHSAYKNPLMIKALMLLNTDLTGSQFAGIWSPARYNQQLNQPTAAQLAQLGVLRAFSPLWGGGRLRMERLTGSGSTIGAWSLNVNTLTASNDDRWHRISSSPVPSTTTRVGAVVVWDEPNIDPVTNPTDEAADIVVGISSIPAPSGESCPSTPSSFVGLIDHGTDSSLDTKKRVILFGNAAAQTHNRCVYIRVTSWSALPAPNNDRSYARIGFLSQ